jgi:hypothetical protein
MADSSLLFYALVAVQVVSLAFVRYFPSQDGPNHVYSAAILGHWNAPESAHYRAAYVVNRAPDANWPSHLLLAALLEVLPPPDAERLFVALYLVLFALGVRYALAAASLDAAAASGAAILVLPLARNWPLHMGLYNYLLGFALVPWALGLWLRRAPRGDWPRVFGFTVLVTVIYFCHALTLLMALAAVASGTLWRLMRRPADAARTAVIRDAVWLVAFVPSLAAMAAYLARPRAGPFVGGPLVELTWSKVWHLADLSLPLLSFRSVEQLPCSVYAAALLLGGAARVHQGLRHAGPAPGVAGPLAAVTAAWLTVYLAAPHAGAGGAFIFQRLSLFPVLGAALWIGASLRPGTARRTCVAVAALALVLQVVIQTAAYRDLDRMIGESVAAALPIPQGATLLPIVLTAYGDGGGGLPYSTRVAPLLHADSYAAVARRALDLGDYEGKTDYFPLRFRPEFDPDAARRTYGPFAATDARSWESRSGRRVDFVIVYEGAGRLLDVPALAELKAALEAGFDVVQTTPSTRLYRRREDAEPPLV